MRTARNSLRPISENGLPTARLCFSVCQYSLFCWLLLCIPVWGQERIVLAGSGSSLAGPVFMVWGQEFNSQQQAIRVTYVSTSSAEGIRGIAQHQGDFAIGEIPLTRAQLRDPNLTLAQIPIAVVSVVPLYNLPGKPQMRFTGELLAKIYLGDVSNWNDRRIAMLNPGIALPNLPIAVVQRPGGTGTRYIWTEFLSQSMPEFRSRTTGTRQRDWGEITASKSKDLVTRVATTLGAIGYVERSFAASSGLAYG